MAHIGKKLGLRLARLRQLVVEVNELGGRDALFPVETLELLAHVIYPIRENPELVAIGHADAAAKVARRHLVEKALRLAQGKNEGPGDHETAEQSEQHRGHSEAACKDQRSAVGSCYTIAQPSHAVLLRLDEPTYTRGNFLIEPLLPAQELARDATQLAIADRVRHVGHHRHCVVLRRSYLLD